jgi:sporulation protein YlmC with PRC-barrel domain
MDIPIHANVTCHDGTVGKSTHIIVDLVKGQVTHFVLKTDHDHKEFVVPIDMIMDSERTVILLNCYKEDVYQLPLFEKGKYNGYDAYDHAPPIPSTGVDPSATVYHPYRTAEGGASEEQHAVDLAVSKGVKVLATDGEVGKIDEFVIDPETHRVTHLVLRQHNIFGKWIVTIPVSEIERADLEYVELKLDKAAIKELPTVALKRFSWET